MNLNSVIYSTRSLTLGEHILSQRAGQGDFEAMAAYFLYRTNMKEEQIMALDDEELLIIINKINEAVMNSIILQQIARTLDACE